MDLWIFRRIACKLGIYGIVGWVMIVGMICSCMVIGMNMGERFLVRMIIPSQEVLDKDAWETLP